MVKASIKWSSVLGSLLIIAGAFLVVVGSALPWANALLFGSLQIGVPGFVFALGAIAASCGVASLFLIRYRFVCLGLGIVILVVTNIATQQIPHFVRGELIAVQRGFFPINELLDKFSLETVMVANYGAKDSDYLGVGVVRTALGGGLILIGSILGLPGDLIVSGAVRRTLKETCKACGAKWAMNRDVLYCPKCATPTPRAYGICRQCGNKLLAPDQFCVKCGCAR
jgi:hypothetical protein